MSKARRRTSVLKQSLSGKVAKEPAIRSSDLLSTGSTLLNLACTGRHSGGFPKGRATLIVGDSDTGKSWLSLTCMAEACASREFDDYLLIHDDAEGGALMDMSKYFGDKAANRIEPPRKDADGNPLYSVTVEDLYDRLDELQDAGQPFIYVVDSMDVLTTEGEQKKLKEQKTARNKGKESAGSYGDGKAKINSSRLRVVTNRLRETGSILIMINQTRDNIGFGAVYQPKTRSGGHALKFYARLELWLSPGGTIKKTIKGKPRKLGIVTKVRIEKNSITGKRRMVEVPILYSSGIDDVGANIDFLVNEGQWKMRKMTIDAEDFEIEGTKESIVKHIEDNGLEGDLRKLVAMVWKEIESASVLKRKKR